MPGVDWTTSSTLVSHLIDGREQSDQGLHYLAAASRNPQPCHVNLSRGVFFDGGFKVGEGLCVEHGGFRVSNGSLNTL